MVPTAPVRLAQSLVHVLWDIQGTCVRRTLTIAALMPASSTVYVWMVWVHTLVCVWKDSLEPTVPRTLISVNPTHA